MCSWCVLYIQSLQCSTIILTSLQAINVLSVVPQQYSFLLQQTHKVVYSVGLVLARIELLGQSEERLRVPGEEANIKYGSGIRDPILLEVVIETSAWGPTLMK